MGDVARLATADEQAKMEGLVIAAMAAGAYGLSGGPFYIPGKYSHTAEIVELAKAAARFPGAFYLDTSLTFDVEMAGKELELYLAVNNLLNKDPAIVAPGPAGSAYATPATNQSLYDLLGRTYRVGIRFKL